MSIVFRRDSQGNEHRIWAQRQANSCAIACIWMARSLAAQMSFQESEWELAWRLYQHAVQGLPYGSSSSVGAPTGPMSIDPRAHKSDQKTFYNMFGNFGTFSPQVAKTMRSEGFSVNYVQWNGNARSLNLSQIANDKPAIVLVGWYPRNAQGQRVRDGGHFVVATGVIGTNIVYLDPWGGVLNELPNNQRYQRTGFIEEILYVAR
jgi:hypothetical protein